MRRYTNLAIKPLLRKIVQDPLSHFLIIGLVLYGTTQTESVPLDNQQITVTDAYLEQMKENFQHTYLRPPSPTEQRELVDNAVMDIALYQEGLRHNLDEADTVVKRRIIQKMNFIIQGMAEPGQPTLPELMHFMEENRQQFTAPPRYSFEHHFIDIKQPQAKQRAHRILNQLDADATITPKLQPDPFIRGNQFHALHLKKIEQLFGRQFAKHFENQKVQQWFGPVPSQYGYHLVRIQQRQAAKVPEFALIRDQVYAAWKKAKTAENIAGIKRSILDQYQITLPVAQQPSENTNYVAQQ